MFRMQSYDAQAMRLNYAGSTTGVIAKKERELEKQSGESD